MLLLILILAAPVPKQTPLVPTAPPPRPVSVWVDTDGTHHNYTRDYWDQNGVLRRCIHEADPEFSRPLQTNPPGSPG